MIITAIIAAIIFCFSLYVPKVSGVTYAAETGNTLDHTAVLSDLDGVILGDKEFNVLDYPANADGSPELINFVEYCYCYYANGMDYYALYAYVYNPTQLDFKSDARNQIQMRIGAETNFSKYSVALLNSSPDKLFYKFKVVVTVAERERILSVLDKDSRVYEISSLELYESGANAVDYPTEKKYTYSGYAANFGALGDTESTLSCDVELLNTLQLKVHPTFYRPDGTNGKNDYTQDSLHSVYFAVPKSVTDVYGGITAVHATWLDAVIAPALITGNEDAFNTFSNYLGQPVSDYTNNVNYMYVGGDTTQTEYDKTYHYYGYLLNDVSTSATSHNFQLEHKHVGNIIDALYLLFYSGNAVDSADNYTVKSEQLINSFIDGADKYSGTLINGKYPEVMFESVADEFTEVNITADDKYTLTSEIISRNWWEKLWGLDGTVNSTTFDGIQAIYPVSDADFSSSDIENANNLYVNTADYAAFKAFYDENKADSTVYLFRYQVTDYIAQEATLYEYEVNLLSESINKIDSNAYFAQETVNLDFDVIDVTCTTGATNTVIPVANSPVDIFPELTPPVYTNSDLLPFWVYAIIIGVCVISAGVVTVKVTNKHRQNEQQRQIAALNSRRNK